MNLDRITLALDRLSLGIAAREDLELWLAYLVTSRMNGQAHANVTRCHTENARRSFLGGTPYDGSTPTKFWDGEP